MELNTPAVRLADLPSVDTEVLVVGAGPTGLMAALVCAARGLPAVVVDKKSGPTRESRALVVQARSMEVYDQLGLAQAVLEGANPARRIQMGEGGPVAVDFERIQRGATPFPGVQIFEQSRNEQLLAQALTDRGGEVAWRHRLVDLVDHGREDGAGPDARVEALLEGPDGLIVVRARWCVGADGAASAVRRELNVPFEGVTDDAAFWVADLYVSGVPDNTVSFRVGARTFTVAFPLGPGHVRLIALAPHEHITQDAALAYAREDLGLDIGRVDWFSSYRVHHRVASRFRVGSVFLAGDAAHIHSPVGGQGMNTGLQDAHNLVHLLADVAQGRVDEAALDRYERERRPVARTLVNVTDRAFGVVGRRGRGAALMRRRVVKVMGMLVPKITRSRFGPRLGGYLGQYRIRYRYLPGGPPPAWAQDPVVGRRLPLAGDNHQALRSMAWQLHTYGASAARPDLPDWIEGPHAFPADPHRRLRADRLYLVRPDGFVAASLPVHSGTVDAHALRAAAAAHRLQL